ncbi:tripartite tricarboxylate transporter substrate binding protein [Bordetella sp. N]|uniref:Bug family tripartite tricarboxylate transporter substrate binding protein n=1 Tax=Bordetella sp. N TaxID=1746199 RepID=UPI000A789376|nr:tripartite tricarboxylate transporter substrate binding protein [Bordetella sp. N]
MKIIRRLILGAVLALPLAASAAESYPSKPIRLIVPFAPGGSVNLMGRLLADNLSQRLGQQVIVENRAGAGGLIGAELVANAAPDGYTLLLATMGAQSILPYLTKQLRFDPKKAFSPIGEFASLPNILVTAPDLPVSNLAELIAYAKAHPGELSMASAGIGSVNQMVGELFMLKTGTQFTHVPYKGVGPAMVDLLGGRVQILFANVPGVAAQVKEGKLKGLGIAGQQRTAMLADVPTMKEAGACDCVVESWFGLMGPAGMPAELVDRLSRELRDVVATPAMKHMLAEQGAEAIQGTPAQFSTLIDADAQRWSAVIKEAKLAD